jgi:hypothetical protein
MKTFIGASLVVVAVLVAALSFMNRGPHNYEECVLENISSAESDVAASIIEATCRKQFPKDGGNPFDQFD